jgi:diadenosine tetraphosphate (Ap4A) HIT family hydrolase
MRPLAQGIVTENADVSCELCASRGGEVLWRDAFCRIVYVDEADYPGFCRVILERHAKEMTDLSASERERLMAAVFATEAVLRELLHPDKINLASLGNITQHLHWHVIPRYRDDRHFPLPVWAAASKPGTRRAAPDRAVLGRALLERMRQG